MIVRRVPWTEQPQEAVGVDWAHPTNSGLAGLWLPPSRIDSARATPLTTVNGGPALGVGPGGRGFHTSGQTLSSTSGAAFNTGLNAANLTALTYFAVFQSFDAPSTSGFGAVMGDGVVQFQFHHVNVAFQNRFVVRESGPNYLAPAFTAPAAGQLCIWVGTYDGVTARAYTNGRQTGTANATLGISDITIGTILLNSRDGDYAWNGQIYLAGVARRVWSAAEIAEFAANPWQLFAPRRIWVPVAAAGGGTTGTLFKTNSNDTVTSLGTTTVVATLSKTNLNDTSTANGTTTITGTFSKTNSGDTVTASGAVGTAVTGTLSRTNNNDTVVSSGTTTVVSNLSKTNNNDTSTANGSSTILATLAKTNNNDVASASGFVGTPSAVNTYRPLTGAGT